jgi:ABC-2 type transport system permease protein
MSAQAAGSRAGWAEPRRRSARARAARLAEGTFVIGRAELQKLRHDPLDLFTRAAQPLLWLFVFGTALRHTRSLTAAGYDYRTYIAPGVMAQAALFIAIFFGLAIIWERDLGQLQRLLATPLPRSAIVLGKAAGAAVRALAQALLLLAVVAVAAIGFRWRPGDVLGALALLALGTAAFACLSMLLASLLRTRERFMGLGQLIVMPLFFASSALYPISIMPAWLRAIARVNPLTYEVHGLRELLIGYSAGGTLWLDFTVVTGFFLAFLLAAARAYPHTIL